jgi:hypothetical protein
LEIRHWYCSYPIKDYLKYDLHRYHLHCPMQQS